MKRHEHEPCPPGLSLSERRRIYNQRYLQRHPEKVRAGRARYNASDLGKAITQRYREQNRERASEYAKARWSMRAPERREADRAGHNKKSRDWKAKNPAAVRSSKDRYYSRNPERARLLATLASQRRRAAFRAAPGRGVTQEEWLAIVESFGGKCGHCLTATATTMDHVEPLARGGAHDPENIVPSCGRCNSSKGARTLLFWLLMKMDSEVREGAAAAE